MFFGVFQALLAEKDNFVWSNDAQVYKLEKPLSTTINFIEQDTYAIETITSGEIKFNANGNLEYFSCYLNESIYMSNNELVHTSTGDVVWTFSNYGTTVITDEDRQTSSKPSNPSNPNSTMSEEKWKNMISASALSNYTYNYTTTSQEYNYTTNYTIIYAETEAYVHQSITGEITYEDTEILTGNNYAAVKSQYELSFLKIIENYEKFQYNTEKNVYEIIAPFEIVIDYETGTTTSLINECEITVSDGKLSKIVKKSTDTTNGTATSVESTFEFSDYETSSIPKTNQ